MFSIMQKFLLFVLTSLIFFSCRENPEALTEKIIGVKLYDHKGDLEDLFDQLGSTGINTLFVSPDLARKSGFMSLAASLKMPVYLIVPTFYNSEALEADSTLYAITADGNRAVDDWVEFICPNREDYRNRHLEYLRALVEELSPDGISIDFIRYFVYWEQVFPDQNIQDLSQTCFDDTCLAAFTVQNQVIFPEDIKTRKKQAAYILSNFGKEWTNFKVETITSYVDEITGTLRELDPSLKFNLHLVPWRDADFDGAIRKIAGQEVERLGPLVDYISPMCYTHMVRRPPEWVHEVVLDIDPSAVGRVLPSIQVSRAYREELFPVEDFRDALRSALKPPSKGVIFWSWEALKKDPGKLEVVRNEIKSL
jgi:hypothetical protein